MLRQQASPVRPVRNQETAFQQLVDYMSETMYDEPGIRTCWRDRLLARTSLL